MKIYYLSASTVPSRDANSVHVMEMCQAFSRNGHQVSLFGHCSTRNHASIFDYYDAKFPFDLVVSKDPMIRRLRGVSRLAHVRAMLNRMPAPDIFYARDEWSLTLAADRGRPFVLEVHSPPSSRLRRTLAKRLVQHPNLARVVVISEALSAEYKMIFPFIQKEKIIVARDGANIQEEPAKGVLLWPGRENKTQIGYVGSLFVGRGIDIIINMARRIPDADFHLVGGRDQDLEDWKKQGLPPNLFFHGHVPHKLVPSYFSQLDILLAPYQRNVRLVGGLETAKWMSPLKVFEYMAAGRPIIVSDLPVLREIFSNDLTAILVQPDDIDSWVAAALRLIDDPSLAQKIVNGSRDLMQKYSWSDRSQLVLDGLNLKA